ncbi:unnamed protein product, partial [Staurois parvus]
MYVKWFDTVMFYYVILVIFVNVTFCHFQISRRSIPRISRRSEDGTQMTDAGICGLHCQRHCRRDIVGAQDKVSDQGIAEQRRMVFPSVALGYSLCYTREYRQGGY